MRVAQRHRRLAAEQLQDFEVRRRQEIRIARFQGQNTHPPGVVVEGHRVKAAHPGVGKVFSELRSSFLAIGIDIVAMLTNVNDFLRQ